MAHYIVNNNQNKTINTLIVSALRSQQVQELENSIKITYVLLDNIFQILELLYTVEECAIYANNTMLGNAITKKNESHIVNIVKKTHNFIRKTKNYL